MKRGGARKSPHWFVIGIAGQIGLWLVDLLAIYIHIYHHIYIHICIALYSNVWLQRLQHAKITKTWGFMMFYGGYIQHMFIKKKGCCLDPTNTRGHYIVGCKTVGPRDHVSSWVMLSQVAASVDLSPDWACCLRQKIRSFSLLWRWLIRLYWSDVEMSDISMSQMGMPTERVGKMPSDVKRKPWQEQQTSRAIDA